MKGLDDKTIERLLEDAKNNIDVDYIWQYVFSYTDLKEPYMKGQISIKELVRVAFLCGINFGLSNIATDEE